MATLDMLDVVVRQNVRYQIAAVDDVGELADKTQDGGLLSASGASATSEDYVEERYKVDRRKLEQMILGNRRKQNYNCLFLGTWSN